MTMTIIITMTTTRNYNTIARLTIRAMIMAKFTVKTTTTTTTTTTNNNNI